MHPCLKSISAFLIEVIPYSIYKEKNTEFLKDPGYLYVSILLHILQFYYVLLIWSVSLVTLSSKYSVTIIIDTIMLFYIVLVNKCDVLYVCI